VQKYLAVKRANTGIDPDGTYQNFIKGDVVGNIDVHRGHHIENKGNSSIAVEELRKTLGSAAGFGKQFQSITPLA
jgi:hypothetical protein